MDEIKPTVELQWPEIAAILFASQGITAGYWRVALKTRFAALHLQFKEESDGEPSTPYLPSGVMAIDAVALFPATGPGPMVFEAGAAQEKPKNLKRPPAKPAKPATKSEAKPRPAKKI